MRMPPLTGRKLEPRCQSIAVLQILWQYDTTSFYCYPLTAIYICCWVWHYPIELMVSSEKFPISNSNGRQLAGVKLFFKVFSFTG